MVLEKLEQKPREIISVDSKEDLIKKAPEIRDIIEKLTDPNLTEEEFVFRFNLYEIINVNIILDMYLERYNEFSIMGGLLSKQEAENMVDMLNKFKKFMDE